MTGPDGTDGGEACPRWYALQTTANHERAVQGYLERAGMETFLPVYEHESRWSDRVTKIERPLFAGYVFCCFDPCVEHRSILQAPGVVRILGYGDVPAPISDSEIEALRTVISSGLEFEPCEWAAGDLVTIEAGALMGHRGVIKRVKDSIRVVVSIELLRRAVAVEIDADWLGHVEKARAA